MRATVLAAMLLAIGCADREAGVVDQDADAVGDVVVPDAGSPDVCDQTCQTALKAVANTWAMYVGTTVAVTTAQSDYDAAANAARVAWTREYATDCASHVQPCTMLLQDEFMAADPAVVAAAANLATYTARRDTAYDSYVRACNAIGVVPLDRVQG